MQRFVKYEKVCVIMLQWLKTKVEHYTMWGPHQGHSLG